MLGLVQLIDTNALRRLAGGGVVVIVERAMGRFVRAGAILARIDPPDAATPDVASAVRAAFDLGPVRTFQEDVEWGFRQIVDIGLKAVSPAINDPSTAATCVDHIARLLTRALGRFPPARVERHGSGVLVLPHTSAADLVDLAFEQLRQYSRNDMAVALGLLRAFAEVGHAIPIPPSMIGSRAMHDCWIPQFALTSLQWTATSLTVGWRLSRR